MAIILPIPKDRTLLFNKDVTQITIGELTTSILEIENDDVYIKQLYKLHNLEYSPNPIKIYIDSHGGDVYHCLGLLGIMSHCKTDIHTIVTGCAMSAGFMILITGHRRFAYKHSTLLYHQISSGGGWGSSTLCEQLEEIDETERLQKILERHILDHTKINKEKLKKIYENKTDWYMTSLEALKFGCVDEIIS